MVRLGLCTQVSWLFPKPFLSHHLETWASERCRASEDQARLRAIHSTPRGLFQRNRGSERRTHFSTAILLENVGVGIQIQVGNKTPLFPLSRKFLSIRINLPIEHMGKLRPTGGRWLGQAEPPWWKLGSKSLDRFLLTLIILVDFFKKERRGRRKGEKKGSSGSCIILPHGKEKLLFFCLNCTSPKPSQPHFSTFWYSPPEMAALSKSVPVYFLPSTYN